jgi:hypothetical protein
MKDTYWFEHDSNAHSDPLIIQLRMRYGLAAYGAFWVIIEALRDAEGYKIDMSISEAICFEYRIEYEWFLYMLEIGLLATDDHMFWSSSLLRRMEAWERKKNSYAIRGAAGGRAKAENRRSLTTTQLQQGSSSALANTIHNNTIQENTEDSGIRAHAREPKPKRKTILTDDWQPNEAHANLSRDLGVDLMIQAEAFRDYEAAHRRLMADWDACFRTWLRKSAEFQQKNGPCGSGGRKLLPQEQTQIMLQEWLEEEEAKNGQQDGFGDFTNGFGIFSGKVAADKTDNASLVQDAQGHRPEIRPRGGR